jgi:flagellar hook-length control protein FliK
MKTIVDLNTVEGAASKLQLKGTDTISMAGSEIYDCFDNSQGDPDGENSNPDFTQNMSGHLAVEQHKVSAASTRSAPFEPLRQGVSEQVLPQIKERLDQYDLKPGKQQITLTLSPDTLGELKMNLNLQGGKLSIEIVTENRSVRDVIVQHADALKESLARQNITMESFDVTTGGKGSGNQGQNQNAWRELMQQQQQQQQQQQYWTTPRGYGVAPADLPSEVAMQQRHQGQSMLDIHY